VGAAQIAGRSWDSARIADGQAVLERALALHGRGPYVVQAAIASLHADEPRDWVEIAALYGELGRLTGSPVVELNRAIAIAEAEGPKAGLAIVDRLELGDYRYLHSTRGELLRRLGSRSALRKLMTLARTDPDLDVRGAAVMAVTQQAGDFSSGEQPQTR